MDRKVTLTPQHFLLLKRAVLRGGMLSSTPETETQCSELHKLGLLITDAAVLIGRPRSYFVTTEGHKLVQDTKE